jgi:hypothetical protein
LRAIILQASANPDEVSVFLFENGRLRGPAAFSILGMRIQNEQSGSTSLFAQPMAIEPVPEEAGIAELETGDRKDDAEEAETTLAAGRDIGPAVPVRIARGMLEARLEAALGTLAETSCTPSQSVRQAHLALLKRWYYRPEAKRTGEIFFPDAEERWPVKAILRGAGRVFAGQFKAPVSGT